MVMLSTWWRHVSVFESIREDFGTQRDSMITNVSN